MKNILKLTVSLAAIVLLASPRVHAQAGAIPDWLKEHMAYMTQGSGIWIADNVAFKGENEPFDAYATQWQYGVGKVSLTGVLYGLRDGSQTPNFWEYHVYWHPKEQKAVFQQVGIGGAVGIGEIRNSETGDGTQRMTEMIFYQPDGTSFRDLHRLYELPNEHKTSSYKFADDDWVLQRQYDWKLQPGSDDLLPAKTIADPLSQ